MATAAIKNLCFLVLLPLLSEINVAEARRVADN
jgi:hypothetical protein